METIHVVGFVLVALILLFVVIGAIVLLVKYLRDLKD